MDNIRVLVIDEDIRIREMDKLTLGMAHKIEVVSCRNIEEATEILEKKTFDVIVSEIGFMRTISDKAVEFLEKLAEEGQHIIVRTFTTNEYSIRYNEIRERLEGKGIVIFGKGIGYNDYLDAVLTAVRKKRGMEIDDKKKIPKPNRGKSRRRIRKGVKKKTPT